MAKSLGEATPNCVIGEGSVFEGRFYINGPILIEGKFKGEIKTNDELVVGPNGRVKTDIIARKVTVAGTLIGNIVASEEVNLLHTGKILGDITTPKLTIEPGVITEGKITITSDTVNNEVRRVVTESYGKEAEEIFSSFKEPRREKPVLAGKDEKKN